MSFIPKHTRFRGYQLVSRGASFSYWDGENFTLGEARLTDENVHSIIHELSICGKDTIDTLYISSWEEDHCHPDELWEILTIYHPRTIYLPRVGPDPTNAGQVRSLKIIEEFKGPPEPQVYTTLNIPNAVPWAYCDVFCGLPESANSNDNSLPVLFHTGNIGVLSVGDLESAELSQLVSAMPMLNEQVDVYILSHHGSSPSFNTRDLIQAITPSVCIALVDRDNQYGHPDPVVQQRANDLSYYYSTKDGDVVIETAAESNHGNFKLFNYTKNGNKLDSIKEFTSKRMLRFS